MAKYIGLDGFTHGWVAASIDDAGTHYFDYSPTVSRLLSKPFKRAMIDMPIGLPDTGRRRCDLEAASFLGSSVFPGVRRNLWTFESQKAANTYYWSIEGPRTGVSIQLWGIREKVKQLDEYMTPDKQKKIKETHPELVFWALAGKQKLARKKDALGREQRVSILKQLGFKELDSWLNWLGRTGIKKDDLIDACVCAVAARDAKHILGGDMDSRGLRMEMHY